MTTTHLKQIYSKRLNLVERKWTELMELQSTLAIEDIVSPEHQAKRQRIGNLYHRINDIVMKPKKDAVRSLLNAVDPSLRNIPMNSGVSINLEKL
jgi:hypothetical protein